jgi:hypothetical protein
MGNNTISKTRPAKLARNIGQKYWPEILGQRNWDRGGVKAPITVKSHKENGDLPACIYA